MLGIVLSLLSAAAFAVNAAAARRAVLSASVMQGLAVTVPLGVPLFFLVAWIFGEAPALLQLPWVAVLWYSAAGIVHFVIGRYCNYAAAAAIGLNLASPIMQCEVLVTLALALTVLGEQMTPLRFIGIALVLFGPGLVAGHDASKGGAKPSALQFKPRYVEGYVYATLAATAYGLSPICVGLALKSAGHGTVLAGGVVSYIAASLAVGVLLAVTRQGGAMRQIDPRSLRWFLLAGVCVCLSHVFRYGAMAVAPVSVVTALQRLSSIIRIYVGWLINREHEVFDNSVILATVVATVGAIILSVSDDTFLALAAWPEWVVRIVRWRWA